MANQQEKSPKSVALMSLVGKRDTLEAEIFNLQAKLRKLGVNLTEPLVDDEGYPRSDIDIVSIRHIRHEIICKLNDREELTKKIMDDMHALHAEERIAPTASCLNAREVSFKPFARVTLVDENSPAQRADLKVGDLIVKFGNIKYRNFDNVSELANLVAENIRRPVYVNVLRCDTVIPLILFPDEWSGKGCLGCRIESIKV